MRKQFKQKRRSCALCKPHKAGHVNRWTNRDRGLLKEAERNMRLVTLTAPRQVTSVGYCPRCRTITTQLATRARYGSQEIRNIKCEACGFDVVVSLQYYGTRSERAHGAMPSGVNADVRPIGVTK